MSVLITTKNTGQHGLANLMQVLLATGSWAPLNLVVTAEPIKVRQVGEGPAARISDTLVCFPGVEGVLTASMDDWSAEYALRRRIEAMPVCGVTAKMILGGKNVQ